MAYAKGKYAKSISDRSGMEFPYNEMVKEWNGARVHRSEYEPKTSQDHPRKHSADKEALQYVRTDRDESEVEHKLTLNPFRFTASSATISVFEPGHGRSSSDTVRFRDVSGHIFGADVDELEDSDGYSITKTDDDFYTFAVTTAAGKTGSGGGGYASSGPATLSA
tara:strand:- start:3768 stop:4262 length:495 start_codon:yes stop_codon:yes gene_type:complete